MLRSCKWVRGSTPRQPLSEVGRRALADRLELTLHYLPLAAERPGENVEYVHRLRVATRRAGAAMRLFRPLLPPRRGRWIRRRLRRVRRSAGQARDLDVLTARIAEGVWPMSPDVRADMLESLIKERSAAQAPLLDVCRRLGDRLDRRAAKLIERVRWRGQSPEPNLATAAREILRPVANRFVTCYAGDLTDAETLHQMRICGKRLRYTMELVAGAFAPTFRTELYPLVEKVQEKLGAINDHISACNRFRRWLDQGSPTGLERANLNELIAVEEAAVATESDAFGHWWLPERAPDFQRRLGDVTAL